ncbi:MAG: helix-turn-helix transcriptional regulator [Mailhella sp.]|nr:helix-turn-helix transcriptional regulator [Mailhella sp.]
MSGKACKKLGVNRERISRLEYGRHTPCPLLLLEIAKACSVSLETLFDDLDD